MRAAFPLLFLSLAGAATPGQSYQGVAPDRVVISGFGIPFGLTLVEPLTGAATPVTTQNISYGGQIDSCRIDPVTGNIRFASTNGVLGRMTPGGTITFWFAGSSWFTDLVFDRDGQMVASAGTLVVAAPHIPAGSPVAVPFAPGPFPSACTALAYDDAAGTLYVGTQNGDVYAFTPPGALVLVASMPAGTAPSAVTGLALASGGALLYASTASPLVPLALVSLGGPFPALAVPVPAALPPLNDIEAHRATGVIYAVASSPARLLAIDGNTFAVTVVNSYLTAQGGVTGIPTGVAVQDFDGLLTAYPDRPRDGTTVTFRAALGGRPGANPADFGVFGIIAVNNVPLPAPLILAQGPMSAAGLVAMPVLAGVAIPLGSTGASFDLAGAEFRNGGVWEGSLSFERIEVVP